jgi:hypothetical protein
MVVLLAVAQVGKKQQLRDYTKRVADLLRLLLFGSFFSPITFVLYNKQPTKLKPNEPFRSK